jgi:hypothetical protein
VSASPAPDGSAAEAEARRRSIRGAAAIVLLASAAAVAFGALDAPFREDSPLRSAIAWTSAGDVYGAAGERYPYPPAFYALFAPLRLLGPGRADVAFAAASVLGAFGAFLAIGRALARGRFADARVALALAAAGTAGALHHAVAAGEPTPLVLALVAATVWAYLTHRDEVAGLSAALAALVKVTPALFLVYFAWKRRWRVVAWGAIGLALFGWAAPALAFGGAGTGALYGEFAARLAGSLDATAPLEVAAVLVLTAGVFLLARPAPDEVRLSRRVLLELGAVSGLLLLASPGARVGHFGLLVFPIAAGAVDALDRRRAPLLAVVAAATLLAGGAVTLDEAVAVPLLRLATAMLIAAAVGRIRAERDDEARADAAPPPTDLALSVFFPAYNEAENIGRVVEGALAILPRVARRFEVIVVDDASRDGTPEVLRALEAAHPGVVRHVRHEQNRGYGGAVKTGLAEARLDLVFFSDGDGQFDLAELPEFLRPLAGGRADAVIGYRRRRADPFLRKVNAYCWGALVRTLFGVAARDIDCAYKALPAALVRRLGLKAESALISTELLAKLERAGCRIVERPVRHLPRERGTPTGANPRVILQAFKELFKFRRELGRSEQPLARSLRSRLAENENESG